MASKKCILFTIPTLDGGGAERVFATYIRKLDPDYWDINLLLVTKTGQFLDLIPEYVNIYDLGKKRTRHCYRKIRETIKLIKPDLIVSTLNRMNILVLLASIRNPNINKICLYEPSMPSAQFGYNYLPRYYLWLMKALYKKADYIIAQTDEMKSEIEEYYSSPKEGIIVVINPIDEQIITNSLKKAVNPYDDSKINIIVSGRIREEKGQDFLIKSFVEVIKGNQQFKLNILGDIGDEDFYTKIVGIIKETNIEKYVEFLGFKVDPYPYYKFADLLVLPSRWEGLPNVVLESLYVKTPVIVTDCIPFFNRLIDEGKNGYIVNYGDVKDMSTKILKYKNLSVRKDMLSLPDFNELFISLLDE